MYTNNKLSKAVRLAIAVGAASATAFTAHTVAADEEASARVERIEITGSRLRQTDLEGANPVTVIDGETLVNMGVVDVGQFIQRMPAMSGSPIGTTTNNGGNGSVTVNLRGLGAARTLVLVNGRRVVDGGDFQTIPASAVKRVEILKEGASTVYGADAVAGVVNVMLKDEFDGAQVSYQRKSAFNVNGNEEALGLLMGRTFNGGHVTLAVDWATQDPIYQGDVNKVDFMQFPWFILDPDDFAANGLIPPGQDGANVFVAGSSAPPCGWFTIAGIDGAQTLGPCQAADKGASWDGSSYTPNADDFRPYVGSGAGNDSYNYAPVNYMQTPYEKLNAFATTRIELSNNLSAFGELRFNKRTSAQELAPTPFFSIFDTPGFNIPPENYYNPFDAEVTGFRRRINDNGFARRFEYDVTQVSGVVGFEGFLLDEYSWSVSYNKGYRTQTNVDFGQLYSPNLTKALGPSFMNDDGDIVCGTPGNVIAGCVPMNMFSGTGAITQEMLDYVTAPLVDNVIVELDQVSADIAGDVMELPAGALQLAVGYEYRREFIDDRVDSGKFMGEVSGNVGKGVAGSMYTNSQYAELLVPLLDAMPFADMMELKLGVRRDDNSIFGATTTMSAGLRWQPMPGLLVRGTYGDVFRAPTIGALFSAASDSFPSASDPCRISNWDSLDGAQQQQCIATGVPAGGVDTNDTQVRAAVGGNPDLQPEEGDSLTVGVSYSPDFLPGFNITVDYWRFDIDGVISSVSANNTLVGCYTGFVDSLCNNIDRLPGSGFINRVEARNANLANMKAAGVDTELRYNFTTEYGDFRAFLGWTHLLERENTQFATQGFAVRPLKGFHDLGETFATNKINATLDWFFNDISVSYSIEWIDSINYEANFFEGGFQNNEDTNFEDVYVREAVQRVPSQIYHDLSAAYDFGTGTRVSLGVTNLFDKMPPYLDAGFNASTDPSTYRMFGRSWFARISQTF